MTRRIVHATIALYPRPWRERYGCELEQIAMEIQAHRDLCAFVLVMDLLWGAIHEHLRVWRAHPAPLTLVLMLVAAVGVGAVHMLIPAAAPHHQRAPTSPVVAGRLSLSTPTVVASARSSRASPVVVRLNPATGAVLSVHGAPARVVIDPHTGQVISATHQTAPTAG